MELDIYILEEDDEYFTHYELFKDKKESHYIQYKKKGEDILTTKRGPLEKLVGKYPYGDDILTVKLHHKKINL